MPPFAERVSCNLQDTRFFITFTYTIRTWEQTNYETSLFLENVFQRPDAPAAIGSMA